MNLLASCDLRGQTHLYCTSGPVYNFYPCFFGHNLLPKERRTFKEHFFIFCSITLGRKKYNKVHKDIIIDWTSFWEVQYYVWPSSKYFQKRNFSVTQLFLTKYLGDFSFFDLRGHLLPENNFENLIFTTFFCQNLRILSNEI